MPKKGNIPWNKGKVGVQVGYWKGKTFTKEHRDKLIQAKAEKPPTHWIGKKHTMESRKKMSNSSKGQVAWNKGKKLPQFSGINNIAWKGDKISYSSLHRWVKKILGNPGECVYCGKDNEPAKDGRSTVQWANIDHKYKRRLKDYIPLCYTCHGQYDKDLRFIIN